MSSDVLRMSLISPLELPRGVNPASNFRKLILAACIFEMLHASMEVLLPIGQNIFPLSYITI